MTTKLNSFILGVINNMKDTVIYSRLKNKELGFTLCAEDDI